MLWGLLSKILEFIYITDVMFSLPDIILVSFIKAYYSFYHSLAEFLMGYLVRYIRDFNSIYLALKRAGLLFFKVEVSIWWLY